MYLKIRSRHPSHDILRRKIRVRVPTVFRLGSFTVMPNEYKQINTIDACMNSANKAEMKRLFVEKDVNTAIYCNPRNEDELVSWVVNNRLIENKLIIKSYRGSRGRGLYLVNGLEEAIDKFTQLRYGGHIIERYHNYNREYRLHVSANGCFYTCRKMLKSDATERWYRNDSNCVWIKEDNPEFSKPGNWNVIEEHCVKALNAVGLDIGACDVRVQSNEQAGENSPKFTICEINSAPSFGELTSEKYINELNKICAI